MHPAMSVLRQALAKDQYDAIIVSHPSNRFYLSGFRAGDMPPDETAGFLVITMDKQFIVTSFLNLDEAHHEAPDFEAVKRDRQIAVTIAALVKDHGLRRIAFEEEAMLVGWLTKIQELSGEGPVFEPTSGYVSRFRISKSPKEIEALAEALSVTDRAFNDVAPSIRAGMTERQVAWMLEERMRHHGAQGPSFETIVAAGTNAARPHHRPTDRALAEGEPIIIDVGAAVDGWMGDLTRTLILGEPTARFKEIYSIVLRAQEACLNQVQAGMTGEAADSIARDIIAAAGYGEAFGHSLGHGLGVRVHEAPNAAQQVTTPLPANSVLTIEPGIYLADWGGVQIEDVGVVTDLGFRNLTGAPKLSF